MELKTEFYLIENWYEALESVCTRALRMRTAICDLRSYRSYDHSVLRSKVFRRVECERGLTARKASDRNQIIHAESSSLPSVLCCCCCSNYLLAMILSTSLSRHLYVHRAPLTFRLPTGHRTSSQFAHPAKPRIRRGHELSEAKGIQPERPCPKRRPLSRWRP